MIVNEHIHVYMSSDWAAKQTKKATNKARKVWLCGEHWTNTFIKFIKLFRSAKQKIEVEAAENQVWKSPYIHTIIL